MSVLIGFVVGLIAGALAYALMSMEAFRFLESLAPLIAIIVFGGVWYVVYKHLEARGKVL